MCRSNIQAKQSFTSLLRTIANSGKGFSDQAIYMIGDLARQFFFQTGDRISGQRIMETMVELICKNEDEQGKVLKLLNLMHMFAFDYNVVMDILFGIYNFVVGQGYANDQTRKIIKKMGDTLSMNATQKFSHFDKVFSKPLQDFISQINRMNNNLDSVGADGTIIPFNGGNTSNMDEETIDRTQENTNL
jgi:hypothetical protein